MDKRKVDDFWSARTRIEDPRIATNYRIDDRLALDIALVSKYVEDDCRILDLGAGTCTLACSFLDRSGVVVAVDKYREFLDNAPAHPKLQRVCSDIVDFTSAEKFDVILLFGVVNFLSPEEEARVYRRCAEMVSPGGYVLVKNQCGLAADVVVDTYSDELSSHYHARYPSVESQTGRLRELFDVSVEDIYPPALNRWENTHFFAFICSRSIG